MAGVKGSLTMRSKLWGVIFALPIVAALAGCRHGANLTPQTEQDVLTEKAGFAPAEGMHRRDVELVLGPPKHTGRTKDGDLSAMYELQRARFRTVIYSAEGTVKSIHPAGPLQPIQLEYKE
jgi:hypothetical protein